MTVNVFIKHISIHWLAIIIAGLTIAGSYKFVVASLSHGQWLTDTVFLAVAQLFAVCAMAIAVFVRPRIALMLCWTYVVLVVVEIAFLFSGYFWVGIDQPEFQGEPLTLRLINREWGYRLIALILAFVALIFLRKNVKKSQ